MRLGRWAGRRRIAVGVVVGLVGVLGVVLAWPDRESWPARLVIRLPDEWHGAGFSADGRSFRIATGKGTSAWDLATGRQTRTALESWTLMPTFSRDRRTRAGLTLDRASGAETLVLGDSATELIRTRFPLQARLAYRVDLIDDDRQVRAFLTRRDSMMTMEVGTWDIATGTETTRAVQGPGMDYTRPMGFSPDGRTWVYLDRVRHGIQLWDSATDRPIGGLLRTPTTPPSTAPGGWISTTFTPDGRTLLVGRSDGQVEFWDVAGLRRIKTLRLHPSNHILHDMTISPDGRTLATSGVVFPSALAKAWESARTWITGRRPADFIATQEAVIIDLATDQPLARFPGSSFVEFSPDGRTIATCFGGRTILIHDAPQPARR